MTLKSYIDIKSKIKFLFAFICKSATSLLGLETLICLVISLFLFLLKLNIKNNINTKHLFYQNSRFLVLHVHIGIKIN